MLFNTAYADKLLDQKYALIAENRRLRTFIMQLAERLTAASEVLGQRAERRTIPCGGCGERFESRRCIGCLHNFRGKR